jgi:hypothetical protein
MDPYLESHWRDIHLSLVVYASDAIQGLLPWPLRARINERVMPEVPKNLRMHPLYPDVWIVECTTIRGPKTQLDIGIPVGEPILVEAELEPVTERFLEIIDFKKSHVVTTVEFLSPSNKSPGTNREQYLRKQREVCSSDANLVEIDLNRIGMHTLAFPLDHIKPQYHTTYMASVRRATRHGMAEVYLLPLWRRLPVIKIPLRPDDADVPLDLQALVEQCYRSGGYEGTLNYGVDPKPPLAGANEEWADELLRQKGMRTGKRPPQG